MRAVNYIDENHLIPADLDIDYDHDGHVDNVCFIVKGDVNGWNDLLWPHKSSMYDREVYLNEKQVYVYNFQLADATSYFNTATMCHEMNHSLSAPDLYHYESTLSSLKPVGKWDLMESHGTPPQHMGAYMKMKYGHWIDEIPEITQAGTYTLNPISSATPENIAYKIPTADPNQFYVLEYRSKTVETALYGSGLLIYRIDTRFYGNANYDPNEGVYDEVYIFRPNGTATTNGTIGSAHFSADVNRTEFSPTTNPYPFYTDGTVDNTFKIYDITSAGNTISFKYGSTASCEPPTNLFATTSGRDVALTWEDGIGAVSYNVYRDGTLIGNTSSTTFNDNGLPYGTYSYFVRSKDAQGLLSSSTESINANVLPNASNLAVSMNALENFVRVQSDAALRQVAGQYAYDDEDTKAGEPTLRSSADEINEQLEQKLDERLALAGIEVVEARINYLAYAPEIAAVMLRRQQADAIIAAREKIVEGAVSMVKMALDNLKKDGVVELDEERKAAMVSNLLVVLCGDEPASPVVNTGTLYN